MITPQQNVLITQGERWLMGDTISDEYLIQLGQKKHDEQVEKEAKNPVAINYFLNKRNRYRRYFDYKRALKAECTKQLYLPRTHDFWIKFYIPMPVSWGKKKRNTLAFEPHIQRPDTTNFVKAFEDALFEEDSIIYDYRASKFWTDLPFGFIEIELGTLPEAKGYTKFSLGTDELK